MTSWTMVVERDDVARAQIHRASAAQLEEGEARLAIERFALTANNVTYGILGDSLGYWRFFPADPGLGQIPVWGYARVEASRAPGVEEGERVFGFLSMSSHVTLALTPRGSGFAERSPHRAELPTAYNRYQRAPPSPFDDHAALLRPVFSLSWTFDDHLQMEDDFGARRVVVTSASSKVGLGLAWLLRRRGVAVVGLTSPRNVDLVRDVGSFDEVLAYPDVAALGRGVPTVLADVAGDDEVVRAVHAHLQGDLVHSAAMGATHGGWASARPAEGPAPVPFFVPDQLTRHARAGTAAEMGARLLSDLQGFVADSDWLSIRTVDGPDALRAAWEEVARGQADPREGLIVTP